MADFIHKEVNVIRKNDPDFPEYLKFDWLRKVGLEHLGKLSGKIWTDHNVHDPGITILEMLCYALMDLGYRTKLPIQDLLALDKKNNQQEDNFFTPAQILTCNPTTITDFRKMIIDTKGVRNAWLEIAENEMPLGFICDQPNRNDPGGGSNEIMLECAEYTNSDNESEYDIRLNGLYKVLLEFEDLGLVNDDPEVKEKNKQEVLKRVKDKLHQHRNLCEDFVDIEVLCREDIGICVEIELEDDTDPEKICLEILKQIYLYLSPQINFYTLSQMLDRGKTIEEIYEGRPYTDESFGFVDSEEVENIKLKKEIHISEIYNLILGIDGIKSVDTLNLKGFINGYQQTYKDLQCNSWIFHLSEGFVPILSFEQSKIIIKKDTVTFNLNKESIKRLYEDFLASLQRSPYSDIYKYLDMEVPDGKFLNELDDYYSIQNEFPSVYGISEGGLSKDVSKERKAQAKQLKGYLLFFDQLLSGYLAQLSHIRDLFSMSPDSSPNRDDSQEHTYFNGELESVPEVDTLIKYYHTSFSEKLGWSIGDSIAILVNRAYQNNNENTSETGFEETAFGSGAERNIIIEQFRRELNQGNFKISVEEDACGYYFNIDTSLQKAFLKSKHLYETEELALYAAQTLAFLATFKNAYRYISNASVKQYSFELVFHPVNYQEILQNVLENENLYLKRRNEFLDHLLSRFSENFSKYASLLYEKNGQEKERILIEQKGRLLSNYDHISRNRGKAYNYLLNGWNSGNVSGFEKKISALSGIRNWNRHNLCNFEIHEYQDENIFEVKDLRGVILFRSQEKYRSEEKVTNALISFIDEVKKDHFEKKDDPLAREYTFELSHANGIAIHPETFYTPEARDAKLGVVKSMFSSTPSDDNIYITHHIYHIELRESSGHPLRKSRKQYESDEKAKIDMNSFAGKVNNQLKMVNDDLPELQLVHLEKSTNQWLDIKALSGHRHITGPRFRWNLLDNENNKILESTLNFNNEIQAGNHFTLFTDLQPKNIKAEKSLQNDEYKIIIHDDQKNLMATGSFKNDSKRDHAIQWLKDSLRHESAPGRLFKTQPVSFGWELVDEIGQILLRSKLLFHTKRKAEKDWRDLINTKGQKPKAAIKKEDNGFRIIMKDSHDQVIAQSDTFDKEPTNETLKKAQSFIKDEKNILYTEKGQAYSFQIPHQNKKGRFLLTSYDLYASKSDAFEALQRVLNISKKKSAYYYSGDEANLNFSFIIQDPGKNFVAIHPYTYGTEKEREETLQEVLGYMKKYKLPIRFSEEYTWQLVNDKKEVVLTSAKAFSKSTTAENDYYKMLHSAADRSNYTMTMQEKGIKYGFGLSCQDVPIAICPTHFLSEDERNVLISSSLNIINSHTYTTYTKQYPHKWKYRFYWETPDNDIQVLLESNSDFDSKEDAIRLYKEFSDNINKVQMIHADNKAGYSLNFNLPGKERIIARHPVLYKTAGERDEMEKNVSEYFTNVNEVRTISTRSTKKHIMRTSETQGGKFVYRVLKKDDPIAYHPCDCFDPIYEADKICESEGMNGLIANLVEKAAKGYNFLEICLGGDIYLKIEDKIYYQIKVKHSGMILFTSYQGYDTVDDARKAFEQNHLYIIELATDVKKYRQNYLYKREEPQTGICGDEDPIAIIPEETLGQTDISQIALLAFTYPIRLVKKEILPVSCTGPKYTYCYEFHLAGDNNDCKDDWISSDCYETPSEAYEAFRLFLYLLSYKGNFKPYLEYQEEEKKCCCRLGIIEILLESVNRYADQDEAWTALHKMLDRVCGDDHDAFYEYIRDVDCCYSFAVVGEDFHLARHTVYYHTQDERDEAIDKLFTQCQCNDHLKLSINILENEHPTGNVYTNIYTFEIRDKEGKQLWHSAGSYLSRKEAEHKAIEALKYAKEDRFYSSETGDTIICKKPIKTFKTDSGCKEIMLRNYDESPETADFIEKSIRYPIVERDDRFGFQYYCDSFEIPVEKLEPKPCPLPPDYATPTERTELVTGGVVWESVATYSSIEEAETAFLRFCNKITKKTNYRPHVDHECGPFSIELVDTCVEDPVASSAITDENINVVCSGILAVHPQCYTKIAELKKGIDRTIECIENEGLHLVEHILLRPKDAEDCKELPRIYPDCDCKLHYKVPAESLCEKEDIQSRVSEDECDEGGGIVVEDYIPGADPYSFQATVVLPCWTKRFRNSNFREAFETLLNQEAPAHIFFNIRWLSPEQICSFENDYYKKWLLKLSDHPCPQGELE